MRQQAGQSALAVRNRSTADRRYSSLASTTDASDQAADLPVKFIGLVDIGVGAGVGVEAAHEPETKPRRTGAGRGPMSSVRSGGRQGQGQEQEEEPA